MSIRISWKLVSVILLAGLGGLVRTSWGCAAPVFRYALERWPADTYNAVIFHRGPLSEADQGIVDALEERLSEEKSPANFRVHLADLATTLPKHMLALWEEQDTTELPWMLVLYPVMSRIEKPLWKGRLSQEAADALLDSPKRREIAKRILEGETAVWVFLESGDSARDEAAATTLSTELDRLEKILELPLSEEDMQEAGEMYAQLSPGSMQSTLPLRLAFSTVRVSRDDPAERVFVDMLMHTEPDLHEYADQPMAFPVFGRGRALYALVGRGINPRTMEMAGAFLAGACSCIVKAQNPGTDLLLSANWDGVLANMMSVTEALPLIRPPAPPPAPEPPPVLAEDGAKMIMHSTLIALAAVLALVLAGTATMLWVHAKRRT